MAKEKEVSTPIATRFKRARLSFLGEEAVGANGLAGGMCIWWRIGIILDIWKFRKIIFGP